MTPNTTSTSAVHPLQRCGFLGLTGPDRTGLPPDSFCREKPRPNDGKGPLNSGRNKGRLEQLGGTVYLGSSIWRPEVQRVSAFDRSGETFLSSGGVRPHVHLRSGDFRRQQFIAERHKDTVGLWTCIF